MEYLKYINPVYLFNGIKDGTIAQKVDNRILSAIVVIYGIALTRLFVISPLHSFYKYFIRPQKDLYTRYGGGWAVVTGASSGIGLGYSKALAKLGFNVLMISRNSASLEIAAQEVRNVNPNVIVKILEFNFNQPFNQTAYQKLYDVIDELKDIAVLVNNVGYNEKPRLDFHAVSDGSATSLLQINTMPIVYLTKHCLGQMVERKNKRSAVISVSSLSGKLLSPKTSIY